MSQELRLADRSSVESVLRSHVEHLQEELAQQRHHHSAPRSGGVREEQLRRRVEELLALLDRLAANSEVRQARSDELIGDLKRANATLAQALERSRKKQQHHHQGRIRKRLEQQQQQQCKPGGSLKSPTIPVPTTNHSGAKSK